MVKPLRKPILRDPIDTENYRLKPLESKFAIWKLMRKVYSDPELLALLKHKRKPPGAWRLWRLTRRPNRRRRFHHAIIDRASGSVIGVHHANLLAYRRASLEVVIFDRRFWGRGAVVEIRRKLLSALYHEAGIRCFTASVGTRNFASLLNYRKLGFEPAGTLYSTSHDELRNEPVDMFIMTLRSPVLEEKLKEWQDEHGA